MEASERQEVELRAENELLLLHLKRVQEELEHYCVTQQEMHIGESQDADIGSRGTPARPRGKPAFSSAILERFDASIFRFADSRSQADSKMQEKHQAYLDQSQEKQALQRKISDQEEALKRAESRLQEIQALSANHAKENDQVKQDLNNLHVEKKALVVQLDGLRADNGKLKDENDGLKVKTGKLKDEKDSLKVDNGKLNDEKDRLKAENLELTENQSVLSAKLQKFDNDLAASEAAITQLAMEKQRQEGKIEALLAEIDQLKTASHEVARDLGSALASHEQSQSRLVELNARLSEKEREAQLGQKILAKVQIDLADMREQYARKTASEQKLIDLVEELRAKLQLASRYYFKIQQQHPDILSALEEQRTDE